MKIFKASYKWYYNDWEDELEYIIVANDLEHAKILWSQRTDDGTQGYISSWTFEEIKTDEPGVHFISQQM